MFLSSLKRQNIKLYNEESDAMLVLGADHCIVEWNKRAVDLFGLETEAVLGKSLLDTIVPQKEWSSFQKEVEQVWSLEAKETTSVGFAFPLHKKNKAFLAYLHFLRIKIKKEVYFILYVRNLESNYIEEQYFEQFKLQIKRMPVGHIVWTPDFKVLTFNPAAEEIFGFSEEEMLGKHPYGKIVSLEGEKAVNAIWNRLLEGDVSANSINENLNKKGEKIICDWANTPLKNGEGEITHVLSMVTDITQQQEYETKLKISEERLALALQGSQDGMWDWDIVNDALYYSPHWEKMFGYETGTAPKSLETFQSRVHPSDLAGMFEEVSKYLNHEIATYNYEFRMFHCDGTMLWTKHRALAMFDEKGNATRMIGTTTNITTLKNSEKFLLKAKEEAEKANQLKSEFLANMSHEIRTPLNAILGFTEILSLEIENEQHKEYIGIISQAGKNLISLINDILDLSKIEVDKIEVTPEQINLKKLLEELYSLFKGTQKNKEIDFTLSISDALEETVFIDELRLKQVLYNLIGNAFKFTQKGRISLAASLSPDTQTLIFTISDTGIGIPRDQQELIFEPFRQQDAQSTRSYGGTGLGLSISKKLVQLMEGDIVLKSEPERGSIFIVSIPYVLTNKVHSGISPIALKELQLYDKNLNVLVVEDNRLNRMLIKKMLESIDKNIMVVEASNGLEALELLKQTKFDLIFMDLMMPQMDGYEANKRIKQHSDFSKIPVIAWTARGMLDEEEKILAEFDALLKKPSQIDELKEIIQRFVYKV
ncbi:MAG: Signal transduction histidine kinase [uncultured Aureispira sp.]|uniref:histidine kinase n=1 Tax=uncultured Aureispira sp. TaxID=1331704 RepID=A0A6S6TC18_9BACT|nr:MAG: Signal transduction histidine kinase [uncultured Aureispira sp.]